MAATILKYTHVDDCFNICPSKRLFELCKMAKSDPKSGKKEVVFQTWGKKELTTELWSILDSIAELSPFGRDPDPSSLGTIPILKHDCSANNLLMSQLDEDRELEERKSQAEQKAQDVARGLGKVPATNYTRGRNGRRDARVANKPTERGQGMIRKKAPPTRFEMEAIYTAVRQALKVLAFLPTASKSLVTKSKLAGEEQRIVPVVVELIMSFNYCLSCNSRQLSGQPRCCDGLHSSLGCENLDRFCCFARGRCQY